MIFREIQNVFCDTKTGQIYFYPKNQFYFMEYLYFEIFQLEKPRNYIYSILGHLSHLDPPKNCLNNSSNDDPKKVKEATNCSYFEIYNSGNQAKYKAYRDNSVVELPYTSHCAFDSFYEAPLSALALSFKELFTSYHSSLTAFQAIIENREKMVEDSDGRPLENLEYLQLDIKALQHIVNLAFLVASNRGGIQGQNFQDWFEYFIQHLACAEKRDHRLNEAKKITFPESFPHANDHMPIVAFNFSQWNPELKKFLLDHGINVGVFTGTCFENPNLTSKREVNENILASRAILVGSKAREACSVDCALKSNLNGCKKTRNNFSLEVDSNPYDSN